MLNTYPKVVSVSPRNQSTGIALDSTIAIIFSADMNASTLTTANVTITRDDTKEQLAVGSVSYSARTWTITPDADLPNDTRIVVTISEDVADVIGRDIVTPYVFSFTTTSAASLDQPVIVSPAHGSVVSTWPTLEVNVAGASSYEYQVSVNPTMVPLETGPSYEAGITYYWRGRGIDSSGDPSEWSTISQFYYGTETNPTAASAEFLPAERIFAIYDISPEPEFNLLASEIATITIQFTTEPASSSVTNSNFILKRSHVTGVSAGTSHTEPLVYSVAVDESDSTKVNITISSTLDNNTELELKIRRMLVDTNGNQLGQDQVIRWSTIISPMYVTPSTLRAMTGSLFRDIGLTINKTDDYFYKHIAMQSAKTNYLSIISTGTSNPTTTDVYNWSGDVTYQLLTYTQLSSLLSVLNALYIELLPLTGLTERLGDLSVGHNIDLDGLKDFIDELQDETADIESSIFSSSAAYGIKGRLYCPEYAGDYSFTPKPNIQRIHKYPLGSDW